jgi:hypothetical protein
LKRLPLVVFVVLVSLPAFSPSVAHPLDHLAFVAPVEAQEDPAKITVFITKTGEKYHRDGCSSLRRSRIAVSLKEAVGRRFGACKICKPPTVGKSR